MVIQTLDSLDRMIEIAKKHGVIQIKVGDVEVVLGAAPVPADKEPLSLDSGTPLDLDAEAWLNITKL
jgi:hypothetical protein